MNILNKLVKEKEELELKIKQLEKTNKKNSILKKYNIMLAHLSNLGVFLACQSIFSFIILALGVNPFTKQINKAYLNKETIIDNNQNIKYFESYEGFNLSNTIKFYNKWEFVDNKYQRTINIYDAKDLDFDSIKDLINNPNTTNNTLINMFKNPTVVTLKQDNVDSDELDKYYIEAYIYDEDKSKYILVEETKKHNDIEMIVFVLSMLLSLIISNTAISSDDKACYIYYIEEKYKTEDLTELRQILNIKDENIKRLTRK